MAVAICLAVAAVAAAVAIHARSHGSLPYYGASAAAFLHQNGGGVDTTVHRAACTRDACSLWFRPNHQMRTQADAIESLGTGIFFVMGLAAPEGAVGASHWRFTMPTNLGLLTAHCSTAQASRMGGAIRAQDVTRFCHARFAPART
jgi:hypothetical protein